MTTREKVLLLESILGAIPELIVYYDEKLNVVWANRAAGKEAGSTPEEMIGRNFFEAACKMEEPCTGCPVVKGISSESAEVIENNLFVARLFYSRTYPVQCRGSKTSGRVFVGQDISHLRNRYSVTEILNLISEVFCSPRGLPEICEELIRAIAVRFDYPAGYITLYDKQRDETVGMGEVDFSGRFFPLAQSYPPSGCFSREVAKDEKVINITGGGRIEDLSEYALRKAGAKTILSVPLNVEGDVTGAIILVDSRERLETNLMIDGLQAVANRLGAEIQRKQTEEKLREERNFTNAVLNNAGPLIMVLDREGRVARFNKACERLTGYPCEEVLGGFIWDFLSDSKEGGMVKAMFPITEEKTLPPSFDGHLITRDGQRRLISWSNSVMGDARATPVHIVSIGIDITDTKKALEESELRRRQLLEADKMASLGVLASEVAHEINNPNNFIMMNTPILRNVWQDISPILDKYYDQCGDFTVANMPYSEIRKEVSKLFDGIEDGSERIRKIIVGMKNYAKKGVPDKADIVNMNDVVAAALELLSYEIRKSTRSMIVEYSAYLPFVRGNSQRLGQIMVNLIQNACQALPDRNREIRLKTWYDEEKHEIVVSVADEGIGISPEHMDHIFDPFFTTKSDRGGTGLGLSVCAGIVKEHNGRLEFESEPGKGTKACLSLPVLR